MLWEREPQVSVFLHSCILLQVYNSRETRGKCFLCLENPVRKREENHSYVLFACAIITVNACASSVFLLSYRSTTFSASILSGCFLKKKTVVEKLPNPLTLLHYHSRLISSILHELLVQTFQLSYVL